MKISIVLIVGLLSGCMAQINQQDLVAKAACCNSYADIEFVKVDKNKEVEFSIDSDNPAFNFAQGPAYYHAIQLSDSNRTFLLRSFFKHEDMKRYAAPVLVELDSNYNVLAQQEPALMFSQLPRFEEPHMQAQIQLNGQTQYLVIYPSNDQTSAPTLKLPTGSSVGSAAAGYEHFPSTTKFQPLIRVPTGKMELLPIVNRVYEDVDLAKN